MRAEARGEAQRLTLVTVAYRKNRANHRLRFGAPVASARRGWHRRLDAFAPGQTFGYIRWTADRYGTQDWRVYALRACGAGASVSRVPGISPGAEVLFSVVGTTRTGRVLRHLDRLESAVGDLADVSPGYWRALGNAVETNALLVLPSRLQARAMAC